MWYGPSWSEDFKPNHASLKKYFPKKYCETNMLHIYLQPFSFTIKT